MNQTEYTLAYLITFGLILLGMLAICVPRPRQRDLPENIERERKERDAKTARLRAIPQAYRRGAKKK